jgi:hypothetical protein
VVLRLPLHTGSVFTKLRQRGEATPGNEQFSLAKSSTKLSTAFLFWRIFESCSKAGEVMEVVNNVSAQ